MKGRNFSDYLIAGAVITCSAVLFFALAAAIEGRAIGAGGSKLVVLYPDITGIKVGSKVKFAGADAGTVTGIRILTDEERKPLSNPENSIEVTLAVRQIPTLLEGTFAAIESDTLLSDKFVAIHPGPPEAAPLPEGAVLDGLRPVTFDELTRSIGGVLTAMDDIFSGLDKGAEGLLPGLQGLISELSTLVREAYTVVNEASPLIKKADRLLDSGDAVIKEGQVLMTEAQSFLGDGRRVILENEDKIVQLLAKLTSASIQLERAAASAEGVLSDNERQLQQSIDDLNVSLRNLRVLTTYMNILSHRVARKPSDLIWGRPNRELPSAEQILEADGPILPVER